MPLWQHWLEFIGCLAGTVGLSYCAVNLFWLEPIYENLVDHLPRRLRENASIVGAFLLVAFIAFAMFCILWFIWHAMANPHYVFHF